jgi:phage tail protein X|nr:MAG TPA: baseplate wedge protein [Caudoviricetes sp.]DAX42335.1 MAG TPA: baseplate wedge protein [Caudoviricetes sp.]
MREYITKSGDTWDIIAKEVYGDEMHLSFLMKNNGDLLTYFIFPSGVVVKIYDLPEEVDEEDEDIPDWRD